MAIEFTCACGAPMRAAEGDAGRRMECPVCGAEVAAQESVPLAAVASDDELHHWLWIGGVMALIALIFGGAWLLTAGLPSYKHIPDIAWHDWMFRIPWRINQVALLVLLSALLVGCLIKHRRTFWGKLVIAGLLMLIFDDVVSLIYLNDFRPFPDPSKIKRNEFLGFLAVAIQHHHIFAYALIFLGIASVPIWNAGARRGKPLVAEPGAVGTHRYPALLILLMAVTNNLYIYWWTYRTIKELDRLAPRRLPFRAGSAILLMFVPVFNYFWFFWVIGWLFKLVRELKGRLPHDETRSDIATGFALVLHVVGLFGIKCWVLLLLFAEQPANVHDSYINGIGIRSQTMTYAFVVLFYSELMIMTTYAYVQRHINAIWAGVDNG